MKRQLAIGDIHGCYTALKSIADVVGFTTDDTIITLGDYVNRGPDSRKVIDWLIRLDEKHQLVPLRGNHEIMMLNSGNGKADHRRWLQVGGDATLRSYGKSASVADIPASHWDFLNERLLPFHESTDHFFVHANAYPDISLEEQPDYMLFWEKLNDPPRHESGKVMICGHTSQKSGIPLSNGNAICIDTWACGEGWLSCLDVESGRIWQANQKGKTRKLVLQEIEH